MFSLPVSSGCIPVPTSNKAPILPLIVILPWVGPVTLDNIFKSDVADTSNISNGPFAGSVTAALFLSKFVIKTKNWIHIDTYAWSDKHVPGHSAGGDILGVRSMFKMIKEFIK